MPSEQDLANLDRGAGGQLGAELAGLLQQLRMAADHAQVRSRLGLEAIQSLLAVGPHPAVERAARVLARAAVRMLVGMLGQLAHQPAAFGRCEPWVGCLSDNALAEQREGFGEIGAHGHLLQGDGAIQPAPANPAQGALVLVPSAWPPLIRLQNRQRPPTRPADRAWARCQATPSASSAARSPSAASCTEAPVSCTASAVHLVVSVGARARKRRHHARTVVCATPSCSAIGRSPSRCTTLKASPRPITSTASSRRTSTRSGNSACVRWQLEQRPRRIQMRHSPPGARSQRQYPPHLSSGCWQLGHRCAGGRICWPAAA